MKMLSRYSVVSETSKFFVYTETNSQLSAYSIKSDSSVVARSSQAEVLPQLQDFSYVGHSRADTAKQTMTTVAVQVQTLSTWMLLETDSMLNESPTSVRGLAVRGWLLGVRCAQVVGTFQSRSS